MGIKSLNDRTLNERFVKLNLPTAIHDVVNISGAPLHLNADGEAVFSKLDDPIIDKITMDPRNWARDDWQSVKDYVDANQSDFYCADKANECEIKHARDYAIPTAARDNQINVYDSNGIGNSAVTVTVAEVSDDVSGGGTTWDCVFTINSSSNITRVMPIPAAMQSDSLLFSNYSYFHTSSYAAWIIGTKTYFFAVFVFRNSTGSTRYINRPCIIEFTTDDPADGNIRYIDYLYGAATVDRAWAFNNTNYPLPYYEQIYVLGNGSQLDPSMGVYHDTSTNIMYVIGCPTTGGASPSSATGWIHHCTISFDIDDATLLTTCCDEDMSKARWMCNGSVYEFTPPESVNYVGYTLSSLQRNAAEYVGVGAATVFDDGTQEWLLWGCRWYETGNALRYHIGILEVNTTTPAAPTVKDHVQATGAGDQLAWWCQWSDSTRYVDAPDAYTHDPTDSYKGEQDPDGDFAGSPRNNGGYQTVIRKNGYLIFFEANYAAVDMSRKVNKWWSYDISGDALYTYNHSSTYGARLGTTATLTAGDETAVIDTGTNTITYKFSYSAVTYEFDYVYDPSLLWDDSSKDATAHATYTDIYFDTSTSVYYLTYGGSRYAPCRLNIYSSSASPAYHWQVGVLKWTDGVYDSTVYYPMSAWTVGSTTSFAEIGVNTFGLLTPDLFYFPSLAWENKLGLGMYPAGDKLNSEAGGFKTYSEGALDYDPKNLSNVNGGYGNNNTDYLQSHAVSSICLFYDFENSESWCSFPVIPKLTAVLKDEVGIAPTADYWGKRCPWSRIAHWAQVVHPSPDTSRDHYAWNIHFKGANFHSDNAAANGRERAFYAHSILPWAHDDIHIMLTTTVGNRNPSDLDSLDWSVWRITKSNLHLEMWPDDFFEKNYQGEDGTWDMLQNSYCDPDYDSWGATSYYGKNTDPGTSVTDCPSPFRIINMSYVLSGGHTSSSGSYPHNFRYSIVMFDLATGRRIGLARHPMQDHEIQYWGRQNVMPDDNNGKSIKGFRIWDWMERFGLGQSTQQIGRSLGSTDTSGASVDDWNTPALITNYGVPLDIAIADSHDNFIVKPANNVLGGRYYELALIDEEGVVEDIHNLGGIAIKPHRSRYMYLGSTAMNTEKVVNLLTYYINSWDGPVYDVGKCGLIVHSSSQNYNWFFRLDPAGETLYIWHDGGASSTAYVSLCEWE